MGLGACGLVPGLPGGGPGQAGPCSRLFPCVDSGGGRNRSEVTCEAPLPSPTPHGLMCVSDAPTPALRRPLAGCLQPREFGGGELCSEIMAKVAVSLDLV